MRKERPYIGIVLTINNFEYFAPLTSAEESRGKLNNQVTIKLFAKSDDFLGAIRLNNMIPCTRELVKVVNIVSIADDNYRNLLDKQYKLIKYQMADRIIKKAEKVYGIKRNRPNDFVAGLCCDFSKLENHLCNVGCFKCIK